MEKSQEYRLKAELCRRIADNASDPNFRDKLLSCADVWMRLADQAKPEAASVSLKGRCPTLRRARVESRRYLG
jgi:hypothetical protein